MHIERTIYKNGALQKSARYFARGAANLATPLLAFRPHPSSGSRAITAPAAAASFHPTQRAGSSSRARTARSLLSLACARLAIGAHSFASSSGCRARGDPDQDRRAPDNHAPAGTTSRPSPASLARARRRRSRRGRSSAPSKSHIATAAGPSGGEPSLSSTPSSNAARDPRTRRGRCRKCGRPGPSPSPACAASRDLLLARR